MIFGKDKNKGGALSGGNVVSIDGAPMTESTAAGSAAGAAASGETIFDVSTMDFEQKVIAASMQTPVIVDFWAPWCGPCKQLMPALEQAVGAAGDKVKLAKLNIDENPELAQAMRVQSVPTVFAFFQGQPVTGFQGAQPPSQIKAMIDQLLQMATNAAPDAVDIPALLAEAAEALSNNDLQGAQMRYVQILQQDEKNAEAYAGLVRTFIAAGEIEQAAGMTAGAPEEIKKTDAFKAAETALELAQNAAQSGDSDLEALADVIEQKPDDLQGRFDYAMALFSANHKEQAINEMLEIMKRDRAWEEDKARLQLLKFFEALGPSDPLSIGGRRKLSTILFS